MLPFDAGDTHGRMDGSGRSSLEDMLRDEAANALTPQGWTVLTGENTYALLRDNGIDPANCGEGECHVATARELNAELFVSGVVHLVDGLLVASIRVIETRTGRILASDRVEGDGSLTLLKAAQRGCHALFDRAGLLKPGAEAPAVHAGEAWIFVRASPSDARLFIDGKEVHAGRNGPFAPGKHLVRGEADGYAPEEEMVTLGKDANARVALEMKALPPPPIPAAVAAAQAPPAPDTAPKVDLTPPAPPPAALPPAALELPPKPVRPGLAWGVAALSGAVLVAGGSAAFDNLAPTSHDRRLEPIDFLPAAGYAVALALCGVGIHQLAAR